MSNFLAWIKGAVDFLAKFLTADRVALIAAIIKIILDSIRKVDQMDSLSNDAKRAAAYGLLTEDLPKIIELGVKLRTVEDSTGKPCITPDGQLDSDCDGTPDHLDPCPNDPHCR